MDIKLPIGNTLRTDGPSAGSKPRGTPSATDSTTATPLPQSTVSESVTLTATARTLSAMRDSLKEAPIDNARVAEIKSALAEGRYEIDNQRLAQRMLEFEGAFS